MSISRKEFLQKACLTGLCICGFGSIVSSMNNTNNPDTSSIKLDDSNQLPQEWIANLLSILEAKIN